jgi:hypothetical protein
MGGKGKHVLKDLNSSAGLEKEWTSAVTRNILLNSGTLATVLHNGENTL